MRTINFRGVDVNYDESAFNDIRVARTVVRVAAQEKLEPKRRIYAMVDYYDCLELVLEDADGVAAALGWQKDAMEELFAAVVNDANAHSPAVKN